MDIDSEIKTPLASAKTTLTQNDLDELCYQYKYDDRNRLIEKKLPGKGWEYFVYDKADRLILSQDANMRTAGKWFITKSDKFGRVLYTGKISGRARIDMQNQAKELIITESPNTTGFTKNGITIYYTDIYFSNPDEVLSVNYYDKYPTGTPFPAGDAIQGEPILKDTFPAGINQSTQSLPTASFVKNIDADKWTKTYMFFDRKGRTIGTYSQNHLSGYTKTESLLDFAGVPQKTYTKHKRLNADTEISIEETFTYDPQNRLLKHEHEVIGKTAKETLAENTYNAIGQLVNKKVGSNLQSVDYKYNIRGWLTGINSDDISTTMPRTLGNGKLFGYRIKYTDPENPASAPAKFNGNIAETDWIYKGGKIQRYDYQYDKLNRLLAGIYNEPDATGIAFSDNNETLTYDLNGNIQTLKRNSKHQQSYTPIVIDNLVYNYNGNKVTNINDLSQNPSGYEGGNFPISYDANGNMLNMQDKGISSINYNYLNLPKEINQNNNITKYFYRADGTKIHKQYTFTNDTGSHIIETEYLDGFQYSTPNTEPLRIALEEPDEATQSAITAGEEEAFSSLDGRVIIPGGPGDPAEQALILSFFPTAEGYYDYENFRYIYQYKDHLGNVRISFVNNNNTPKVMDINDYYPFGMSFLKPEGVVSVYDPMAIPYNYKFQEQELQETGFYAFKWRQYMPDVGRFFVIDKLTEEYEDYTPYQFSSNQPIHARELEGLENANDLNKKNLKNPPAKIDNTITATKSVAVWGAYTGVVSSIVRKNYVNTVSKLDVSDTQGRTEAKMNARSQTPALSKAVLESERPSSGELSKTSGTANKTNAEYSSKAGALGKVGIGMTALAAGASVYNIATSENPAKQAVEESFIWTGAVAGGETGAAIGSVAGPPGALVGGVTGSILGGMIGGTVMPHFCENCTAPDKTGPVLDGGNQGVQDQLDKQKLEFENLTPNNQ